MKKNLAISARRNKLLEGKDVSRLAQNAILVVGLLIMVVLGLYHVSSRMADHKRIDGLLIDVLNQQRTTQLDQQCLAAGYGKLEPEPEE